MTMEIDGGHDVDFVQQTQAFLQWFKSLPGATFHPDIELVDLRGNGAGRGIIAKADIPPDTTLFTIPRSAILCAATSPLAAELPSLFNHDDANDDNSQDSWTLLILILVREYLNPNSQWKPYISLLPTLFSTPMFWPPSSLSSLQASSILPKIGRSSADSLLSTRVLPVVTANPSIFYPSGTSPLSEPELLSLAHQCGSAIMAYAFDLSPDDDDEEGEEGEDGWVEDKDVGGGIMGMVPMADMLNADAEFNAHINHGEESLTATSLRGIKKGEEVLNYYGPLGNGELLRRYGYVTEKHARWDVVEVGWGLVEEKLRGGLGLGEEEWRRVRELVRKWEEEEGEGEGEESFVLEWEGPDPDGEGRLSGEVKFGGLPEELAEKVKVYLKGVRKVKGEGVLGDKTVRKQIYLECVLGALKDREREYATTLEEDEKLLMPGRPTDSEGMALWVRIGEKRLLREAQRWVAGELEGVRREMSTKRERGDEDAPAAKRRRA